MSERKGYIVLFGGTRETSPVTILRETATQYLVSLLYSIDEGTKPLPPEFTVTNISEFVTAVGDVQLRPGESCAVDKRLAALLKERDVGLLRITATSEDRAPL